MVAIGRGLIADEELIVKIKETDLTISVIVLLATEVVLTMYCKEKEPAVLSMPVPARRKKERLKKPGQ